LYHSEPIDNTVEQKYAEILKMLLVSKANISEINIKTNYVR